MNNQQQYIINNQNNKQVHDVYDRLLIIGGC